MDSNAFPTHAEYRTLCRLAQAGDNAALDRIIRGLTPLVHKQAARLAKAWRSEKEDLAQVGLMAIVAAVKKFDPERPIQFVTYCFHCILNNQRQEVRRLLRQRRLDGLTLDGGGLDVAADPPADDEHEQKQCLKEMLANLHIVDRQAMAVRFGLDSGKPATQEKAAAVLGVSIPCVRLRVRRGIERIRKHASRGG